MEAKLEERNEVNLIFDSRSVNERFARMAAAAFVTEFNPTLDEIEDVKTAVSEAVTNAIIHGYEEKMGKVEMLLRRDGNVLEIVVTDKGKGIADIEKAMQPFYTSKPKLERSGMGFSFMEAFMDSVEVTSVPMDGTTVTMRKKVGAEEA